jgi:hypothetical protein
MRRGVLGCAVLLCAMPAHGDLTSLPPAVVDALTQIDASPSQATLNEMFSTPQAALDNLRAIALDHTGDPGVQLRAIRALPVYCPASCGSTVVHDALHVLIDHYNTTPHTPRSQLRLRAAVEALGATRTGLPSDVTKLVPLLADPSRDVRLTVTHALRKVCSSTAIEPLRALFQTEPVKQVQNAISAALLDLRQCP